MQWRNFVFNNKTFQFLFNSAKCVDFYEESITITQCINGKGKLDITNEEFASWLSCIDLANAKKFLCGRKSIGNCWPHLQRVNQ